MNRQTHRTGRPWPAAGRLRWTLRLIAAAGLLLLLACSVAFRGALGYRLWRFPRQARALAQLAAQRQAPALDDGWNDYRGVVHAHSERSHDSAVTQAEAVRAAHAAHVDFLCLADHYADGLADYSQGWQGVADGVLFIRGYELSHGPATPGRRCRPGPEVRLDAA